MPKIVVVAHNVWLIPFSAPWMFGRCERICNHQRMVVGKLRAEAGPDALMIVALQELWAFRTGPTWPLLWLVGKLQSKLLRAPRRSGGHEPVLLRIISGIVMALSCLFAWLPLPFGLWNPKDHVASELATAGLPYAVGTGATSLQPLVSCRRWPPPVMDSGLLLCSSHRAEDSGFIAYSQGGSAEDFVNKGILWARFGSVVAITTHMTAERAAVHTDPQRARLGEVVAWLLTLRGVEHVLVAGDLNHWQDSPPPPGAPHVSAVIQAIEQAGSTTPLEAVRVSSDDGTNYDNFTGAPQCIDHVICVRRRREKAPPIRALDTGVVDDFSRHVADHNLLHVTMAL